MPFLVVRYLNLFLKLSKLTLQEFWGASKQSPPLDSTTVQIKVQLIGGGNTDVLKEREQKLVNDRIEDLQLEILERKDWS